MSEIIEFLSYLQKLDVRIGLEREGLKIDAPEGALTPEIKAELSVRKKELIAFLHTLPGKSAASNKAAIRQAQRKGALPLSYSQKRMWLMDQFESDKYLFNASIAVRIEGVLDVAALKESINGIIARHEVLRSVFREEKGQAVQVILSTLNIALPEVNLDGLSPDEAIEKAKQYLDADTHKPFDLINGPLLRARLLREGASKHIILLTIHHIVSDDWSLNIFLRELTAHYKSITEGKPSQLPQLPIQYTDYAVWQRDWIKSEDACIQRSYWKKCLENITSVREFPTDMPHLRRHNGKRERCNLILSDILVKELKSISRQEKSTLFMTLLAGFKILLHQYTLQTDIAVVSPVAGRTQRELEGLIGFFVNTIILRSDLSGNPSFRKVLRQVREITSEAYAHQDLPFEETLAVLPPEEGTNPFRVFFNMPGAMSQAQESNLLGLASKPFLDSMVRAPGIGGGFDLTMIATERQEKIYLDISYNTDLFKKSTIDWLVAHYRELMESIAVSPDRSLADLPALCNSVPENKKPAGLFEFINKEEIGQSLAERFEKQAAAHPESIAVSTPAQSLTYDILNRKANRLAHAINRDYDGRFKLSRREKTRYARQMLIGDWGTAAQEKLKSTTVFVAGSGGSCNLLVQLSLCGFGTIVNCDFDTVELSNLNRQMLHNESRIGMNKALSAKKTLDEHGFNPNVKIIAHTERITRDNVYEMVGDAAILFDLVDDPESKFALGECAVAKGIPMMLSSMIDMSSYACILHPPKTPCFHCLYEKNKLLEIQNIRKHIGKKSPQPVVAPSMFLSCGFIANEALKIVLGLGDVAYNKYFFFNQRGHDLASTPGHQIITYPFSEHFRRICREQGFDWDKGWSGNFVEELTLARDPDCPICGERAQAKGISRFSISIPERVHDRREPATASTNNHKAGNQTIALLLGQEADMLIGIVAAAKAGKIFTVLDPKYPELKIEAILEDSEARLIITNTKNIGLARRIGDKINKNIGIINIENSDESLPDKNSGIYPDPDQIAYIVYTSGSTGQPKGVTQSHRNVLHFIRNYINGLHINREDRLSVIPTFSFSAAMMDVFAGLFTGAAIYPFDMHEQGIDNLGKWLTRNRITVYHSVPTVFRHFVALLKEDEVIHSVRVIDFGGEPVSRLDLKMYKHHFSPDCILVNGLGATELNVIRQYYIDQRTAITEENVPVGYAVEDTEVLILDESGKRTGFNSLGEIVIRSQYLSPGYWQNPDQTNAVFTTDSNDNRYRLFHTGDLGRIRPDGCLEHLGRKDFQVKIRGVRIELSEIEICLLEIPGVREAVVIGSEAAGGNKQLIAYIVRDNGGKRITSDELRAHVAKKLQPALIPSAFVMLDSLPLTSSGKVDRKALPAPVEETQNTGKVEDILSMLESISTQETHAMMEELKLTMKGSN
jgi:amino acid adenylation domain-containing protein